jgi:hypothetical protein
VGATILAGNEEAEGRIETPYGFVAKLGEVPNGLLRGLKISALG